MTPRTRSIGKSIGSPIMLGHEAEPSLRKRCQWLQAIRKTMVLICEGCWNISVGGHSTNTDTHRRLATTCKFSSDDDRWQIRHIDVV
jgi:hypothetical protein